MLMFGPPWLGILVIGVLLVALLAFLGKMFL